MEESRKAGKSEEAYGQKFCKEYDESQLSESEGRQISYSASQKFKKGTVKSVTAAKSPKAIKKLKKGKAYYVKVCAFKKDSAGKKVCGAYSPAVKVTIKK